MAAGDQAAESMARTFIEVLIESKKWKSLTGGAPVEV
jgi:hypothetical protein